MAQRPFSPAVKAAIALIAAEAQRQVQQLLREEAQSLELPEPWQTDIAANCWILAEPPV